MAFKNTYNKRTIITHLAYLDGTQVKFLNGGGFIYVFNTNVSWKGHSYNYGKNFGEMRSIDLSSNKLTGEILAEMPYKIENIEVSRKHVDRTNSSRHWSFATIRILRFVK